MTTTTSAMSAGSVHDYVPSDEARGQEVKSPRRAKRHSPRHKKDTVSDEVKEEIEELLSNVSDLKSNFTILDKIGAGTFSSVYVAKLKNYSHIEERFALKHIIPTSHPSRIENELRCLKDIGGCDNVMGVKACLRARDHVVIVMPYFPHDYFPDYLKTVTVSEVQEYMHALMVALRRVHMEDIIHRDVKPTNFLVNRSLKKYALVDFGLAQKAPVPLRNSSSSTPRVTLSTVPSASQGSTVLSPTRKSRRCSNPGEGTTPAMRCSPRKRKLTADENLPESPRKRRSESTVGGAANKDRLMEVDLNAANTQAEVKKETTTLEPPALRDGRKSLTPTAEPFSAGYMKKSPRRMLLTKRALDLGRSGTESARPASTSGTAQATGRTVVVQKQAGRSVYKAVAPTACQCFGKPMVCNICLARSPQVAPRAGTPGFRAPEVLMKCPDQTTAVDMWSAGVIFLSLLSGRYPFFKADDDMTALAQIISILGTEKMKQAAKAYKKELLCKPTQPSINFRTLCERLRNTANGAPATETSGSAGKNWGHVPDAAFDLLVRMLEPDPGVRITAEDALAHPFLASH